MMNKQEKEERKIEEEIRKKDKKIRRERMTIVLLFKNKCIK